MVSVCHFSATHNVQLSNEFTNDTNTMMASRLRIFVLMETNS